MSGAGIFRDGVFDDAAQQVRQNLASAIRNDPDPRQRLADELKAIEREQRQIIEQISERKAEGRPRLAALDDMLDTLEERRTGLETELRRSPAEKEDFDEKIKKLKVEVSPEAVEPILNSVSYYIREHADAESKQPFINIARQFIQKVVIGKTQAISWPPSKSMARSPRSRLRWMRRRSWRSSSRP